MDTPDSSEEKNLSSPPRVNGTRPGFVFVTSIEKFLATSYPKPLPPRVGIESAPVVIIREVETNESSALAIRSLIPPLIRTYFHLLQAKQNLLDYQDFHV